MENPGAAFGKLRDSGNADGFDVQPGRRWQSGLADHIPEEFGGPSLGCLTLGSGAGGDGSRTLTGIAARVDGATRTTRAAARRK